MRFFFIFILTLLLACPQAPAGDESSPIREWNMVSEDIEILSSETLFREKQLKQSIGSDRKALLRAVEAMKHKAANARKRAEGQEARLHALREQEEALQQQLDKSQSQIDRIENTVRNNTLSLLAGRHVQPWMLMHPESVERLDTISQPERFPSMQDISFLLDSFVHSIAESGKVIRGDGPVLRRDGGEAIAGWMRVGAFQGIFVSDGAGFLVANPETNLPLCAPYQPDENETQVLRAAMNRENQLPLDVSNGKILVAPPKKDSLIDKLKSGGMFLWPIVLIGCLGVAIILERCFVLFRTGLSKRKGAGINSNTPAGRVIARMQKASKGDPESADRLLEEAILDELPPLERFLQTLRVFAAVSPLLGLLGTVSGIIQTFRVITHHGNGDPALLSAGISEALLTTEMGLVVAVPLLLCHHFLTRRKNAIVLDMEAVGAAYIARQAGGVA